MDDIYPLNSVTAYYRTESITPSNIYFESVFSNKEIPFVPQDYFLFSFPQIKHKFSQILNNWFTLTEKIDPALNLYFAMHIHKDNFLETRFILMAQCLETLHSWNTQTSTETSRNFPFKKRLDELIDPFKNYLKSSESLSSDITLIRNYYTHYNDKYSEKIPNSTKIVRTLYQMKAIFQLHILQLLSFSDNEIHEIIMNNKQIQWNLWLIEK